MSRPEKRVVLAKGLARKWLLKHSRKEHRIRVFCGSKDFRHLPNLLRLFRDGKVVLGGMEPISDLGVTTRFDSLSVWSSDHDAMLKLNGWFEEQGLETTGIW